MPFQFARVASASCAWMTCVSLCVRTVGRWQAHEMEAWVASWDCHERDLLYSGADDGFLKRWDMRALGAPTWVDRRSHQAGVCCIQSHPKLQHLLATGSYDETVRLYDTRQASDQPAPPRYQNPASSCRQCLIVPHCVNPTATQTRAPLTELNVGGGVWRLKWSPDRPELLAAATMHAGFAVLRYDHAAAAFAVLHSRARVQHAAGPLVTRCITTHVPVPGF
jgi:diphthamide biosynthesis protein 7